MKDTKIESSSAESIDYINIACVFGAYTTNFTEIVCIETKIYEYMEFSSVTRLDFKRITFLILIANAVCQWRNDVSQWKKN